MAGYLAYWCQRQESLTGLSLVRQPGALCGPLGGGRARVARELQGCLDQHYGLQVPTEVTGGAQTVDLGRID